MPDRVRRWWPLALILVLLTVAVAGLGAAPPTAPDRAQALEERLRCPVCKSVSIAESPSETAAQMRRIVAAQVAAGRSDQEIIAYFEDRYGPWVLQDPPLGGQTLWLWLLVALAVTGGGAVLGRRVIGSSGEAPSLQATDREAVSVAVQDFRVRHKMDDEP